MSIDPEKAATRAPRIDYTVDFPAAGEFTLEVRLLPTHPIVAGRGLRFAVGLDDAAPQPAAYTGKDGSAEWAQGVLNNYVAVTTKLSVSAAGPHTVQLYGIDPGVVLTRLIIR